MLSVGVKIQVQAQEMSAARGVRGGRRRNVLRILLGILLCAELGLHAQGTTMDVLRRRVDLQSRIHPAGIGLPRPSVQTTLHKLERVPALQRAISLSAFEEQGSTPFHLHGTLDWISDTGHRFHATLEEDWYNDRWSRTILMVDNARSRRFILNGDRRVDDELPVVPFTLRRLLAALYDPLGDVEPVKGSTPSETITVDGRPVRCITLPSQPPPTNGMIRHARSACVDDTLGDLRVEGSGYGLQTIWNDIRIIGARRVAASIQILRAGTLVGTLTLDDLHVAGDLTPSAFRDDLSATAKLPHVESQERLMATPAEMRGDLASIDVHLIPLGDEAVKRHEPMAVARVLVGPDGRLADLEFIAAGTTGLRQRTIDVLNRAYFRERTWNGKPISTEGLLLMGLP